MRVGQLENKCEFVSFGNLLGESAHRVHRWKNENSETILHVQPTGSDLTVIQSLRGLIDDGDRKINKYLVDMCDKVRQWVDNTTHKTTGSDLMIVQSHRNDGDRKIDKYCVGYFVIKFNGQNKQSYFFRSKVFTNLTEKNREPWDAK